MAKFNVKDLSPKMDGKFYYGWVMLFMGFLCMFICYVIKANCTSLFYTPICEEFGVTRTVYAQTNTFLTVTMLIGSMFMGKLMVKFKLKYVLPIYEPYAHTLGKQPAPVPSSTCRPPAPGSPCHIG